MELEQIWEENKIKYECRQVTDEITEDDKVNYDFLIVMSKFLLYQDFSIVRKNVCRLVERGSKRALAFYFKFEELSFPFSEASFSSGHATSCVDRR